MENTKKENKFKKFWNFFSLYEKIWFFSIVGASLILTIFFPGEMLETEESAFLIILCLINIVASCSCELLLSKQSKWNFLISLFFIEITECIIFFSLGYYATACVAILFWIPIDIISFINWNKNQDKEKSELTVVRKLTWWQDIIVLALIAGFACLWGFVLSPGLETLLDGGTGELDYIYFIDAIAAGFGIANGVCILLRLREQWIAWLTFTVMEAVLFVLGGTYIMLILTVGYLTNSIYGLVRWSKYIKNKQNKEAKENSNLSGSAQTSIEGASEDNVKKEKEDTTKENVENSVSEENAQDHADSENASNENEQNDNSENVQDVDNSENEEDTAKEDVAEENFSNDNEEQTQTKKQPNKKTKK